MNLFWKAHERWKPEGYFSEDFKDLIGAMFHEKPHMRLTMADLIGHPWLMGETATREQVHAELTRRQEVNKRIDQANDEQKVDRVLYPKSHRPLDTCKL